MLASKSPAGVAPEVNLRIPLHTGDKTYKQMTDPGFETQSRHHKKSKTRIAVAPQKGPMSSKKFFKKKRNFY